MTNINRRLMTSSFRPQVTPLEDRTTPTAAYALSGSTLFSFDTATPTVLAPGVAVTGLGAGENLVGIDIRPQNGQLYGLTSNGAGAVRLYAISPTTGAAVALSATPVQFDDGGGNPIAITGTNFGFDFNPTVDRIRVVTDTGVNFRINPNTGGIVDGNAGTAGINPDGAINGDTTTADAVAYTNNAPNATATTLYALDAASNKLELLNPPNNGTATNGTVVTLNGSTLDFTAVNGFDIPAGVAVGTSNAAATGSALAILTTASSAPALYSIDLATAKATLVGNVGIASTGSAVTVQGFAVQPNASATGIPFVGVAGGNVVRFNSLTPGTTATAAITGLAANESVVGIDRRPATGQYLALIQNSVAGTVRIAVLDPQTGGTTAIGAGISLVDAAGAAITFPAGTAFGVDINPTVDKLRVVASTGTNFRVDPTTGAAVDGDATAAGAQPDAALNGGSTKGDATAYTNSFNKATVTTQYTLDASTDKLYIQNPPNAGTLTNGVTITVGGTAIDFTDATGFDIPSTVQVSTANAAATGVGYASLTVAGSTALYSINLVTGAAAKLGLIGTGTTPAVGLSAGEVAITSTGLTGTSSFAAGTDAGAAASAKLFNADRTVAQTVTPFSTGFTGGVRTATADFNGDGVNDLVVGSGPGIASDVRIIDGKTGTELFAVAPFEAAFTGGVYVAAGDVTGDGIPELVVTPDQGGGPRVRIFRSGDPTQVVADFFGIADPNFRGGARAAIGDVNGDGVGDLGVAAGFGGGPRVAVFDGTTLAATPTRLFNDFFAFETTLRNGVFLALGDIDGDGKADIVAGGGPGGGPRVTVFNGATLVSSSGGTITPIANFFAGDAANRGGIRVTVKNLDGDSKADLIVGSGTGAGTRVTAYAGTTVNGAGTTPAELFAFDAFSGSTGVFVG
ncbi:DUF4394 domain-containing protein [Limnoglobus roseus]|uniref:DUF4394 domain-containing protein n=1 Tax=Limnoglobus roseus TaxID=2598579 RepID=A0A5C1AB71_9BACT|nr:DUF4394 domain-containing protein [Limnoglobus roseus]QEL15062.1 hypothetical protein PX52LOC_01968 [Limnoglobus roseus]